MDTRDGQNNSNRKRLIVEIARSLLGVPFVHQGRHPKYGLDCVGLLIIIGKKLGLEIQDVPAYSRWVEENILVRELLRHGLKKTDNPTPGDILVFKIAHSPQHVAIMTDIGMIHAYATIGKVVEHVYSDKWKKRLVLAYTFGEDK